MFALLRVVEGGGRRHLSCVCCIWYSGVHMQYITKNYLMRHDACFKCKFDAYICISMHCKSSRLRDSTWHGYASGGSGHGKCYRQHPNTSAAQKIGWPQPWSKVYRIPIATMLCSYANPYSYSSWASSLADSWLDGYFWDNTSC